MTTEQAKCVALHRLLKKYGEEALLANLHNITVSTTKKDDIVTVCFQNDSGVCDALSFVVKVNCVTGESCTFESL